jgi:PAS domain S-box-containing protein
MRFKPKTHSFIVSMYILAALVSFSLLLLGWSYRSSIAAIDKELVTAFAQRQTTAQSILETQMELVKLSMKEILDGPFLLEAVNNKEQARSTNLLIREMDASAGYGNLDIIFISTPDDPVWADASFSLFDIKPLLPAIAGKKIPRAGMIFKSPSSDLIIALKSIPIIHPDTGKVMGKVIGGFVLNDNLDILELIRRKTRSDAVKFFSGSSSIGSTELEDSSLNTLLSQIHPAMESKEVFSSKGVIASYDRLSFNGQASPLDIMMAVSDTAYESLKQGYRIKTLIMFILALGFSILFAWLIKRLISPSLNQLLTYSDQIRSGNMAAVYKPGNTIELNRVGNAMEAMVESLATANKELDYLQNYLSNIINSMPSIIVGIDMEKKVTQWNRGAVTATGLSAEQVLKKPMEEVFPRLARKMPQVEKALKTRLPLTDPKMPFTENDEQRFEDITIYPLVANGMEGAVIRLDDVTEQVRMEEVVIQSEKMLSVGGLAAGMAHEINNPLAGMIQTSDLLKTRLTRNIPANLEAAEKLNTDMETIRAFMVQRKIPALLDTLHAAGLKAADIVTNMLSFARKGDSGLLMNDLADLMDETLALAGSDYDLKKKYDFRQIRITKDYHENTPPVPCEPGKIQQVFLNILTNGAQAMCQKQNRESTGYEPEFTISIHQDRAKGGDPAMAEIQIRDNGPGMDEKTRKRIFEPFFTTKPQGIGTGLGLSVSYFIIRENHNGRMDVASIEGRGTTFTIKLPLQLNQS